MKTLVLDLDETLVFSSLERPAEADYELSIGGQHCYVRVRPGLAELIAAVRPLFACTIWSTGQPIYVQAVCRQLGLDWMQLWGRDRCRRLEVVPEHHHEPYDKPLERIGSLDHVVIVDNAPGAFACNPDNGIPINTWRGDTEDRQLFFLAEYLVWLAAQPDVRRNHWRWATEILLRRNAELR